MAADGELTGGAGGPFALIQPWLGESAQDKIRRYLDQQAAANAGAVAGDVSAPFSGAYATPPTGQPAKPPMGAAAPGPGEPQASKTPESWGSMLMDLQQQQEAQAGFNSSIGMGLSAFSQPRDREMVAKMFNTAPPPDPFHMGESLMNMSSQQQGQDRANQIARLVNDPTQGPLIAQKMNMDWNTLKAGLVADPGLVAKITQAIAQPTPVMADLDQATRWMQQQGWDAQKIKDTQNLILTGVAKSQDLAQMELDRQAYKARHNGVDPPWAGNPSAWKQSVANTQELNQSVNSSQALHANNIAKVTEMQNRVEALKTNPGLKEIVGSSRPYKEMAQYLLEHPGETPAMAIKAFPKWTGVTLSDNALAAISELQQLKGMQYATALQNLHMQRPAATEVEGINKSLGQLTNLDLLNSDSYVDQAIDPMVEDLKTVRGNSYGSSQDFRNLPEDLKTYVNPEYLKGGNRNLEDSGSEGWSDSVKMAPEEVAAAGKLISSGAINPETKKPWTRAQVNKMIRSHGKRPEGF